MPNFTAVAYQKRNVGKHFKFSRIQHSWLFYTDEDHSLDVFISKFSKRVTIAVDGKELCTQKLSKVPNQRYNVSVGGCQMELRQTDKHDFELFVDSYKFGELVDVTEREIRVNPTQAAPIYEDWEGSASFEDVPAESSVPAPYNRSAEPIPEVDLLI